MPIRGGKNSFFKKYSLVIYLLGGLFILWVILEFLGIGMMKNTSVSPSPISTAARTFTASEVMGGFMIDVPEGFEVEEKNTAVFLKKKNELITIYRIGTNYTSLKEIFDSDPDLRNRKINYSSINDLEAAFEIKTDEKSFFIYKDFELFSITTVNKSLYSNLDQIAQSFRISPL